MIVVAMMMIILLWWDGDDGNDADADDNNDDKIGLLKRAHSQLKKSLIFSPFQKPNISIEVGVWELLKV